MVDHSTERRVMSLAARQFGVLTRNQVMELGMSADSIDRRHRQGLFISLHRAVYRVAAVPPSYHQGVLAATWWAASVASHRCALKLWGVDGYDGRIIEVIATTKNHSTTAKVIVHVTDRLPRCDVQRLGPIELTSPSRTLLDIGAVLPEARVEEALDSALRQGLTSITKLKERLAEVGGHGRRGTRVLRTLLNQRGPGLVPTDSTFETRLSRLLARNGLPTPVRQFAIFERSEFVARPDFSYPAVKIAIEAQSVKWHLSRVAWERDMERLNRLQGLGWLVIFVSSTDLKDRPLVVANRIRSSLVTRSAFFQV